jgi:hypothetical protein
MKFCFIFLIVILLIACEKKENFNLTGKVFETGAVYHFTDSCKFYFECDCCAGELAFSSGSDFYALDFCISDQTLVSGTYEICGDSLMLRNNGISISKNYNWENEVDSTAIDFLYTETFFEPSTYPYLIKECGNKIKLVSIDNKFIAIELDRNYEEFFNYLKGESLLSKLERN